MSSPYAPLIPRLRERAARAPGSDHRRLRSTPATAPASMSVTALRHHIPRIRTVRQQHGDGEGVGQHMGGHVRKRDGHDTDSREWHARAASSRLVVASLYCRCS